tara:strand:- start:203 stop:451 length:249 start_codon:yes stop_codon:yes gene_type:complete
MQTNETVITSLAKQVENNERTEMSAGIELQNLASIGYMDAVDMLKAERKKIINIQMQMELRDQEDQLDNEQWERDYQAGVMA